MLVYIAGPLSKGPLEMNIRNAVSVGRTLLASDIDPVIPHLYCFMEMMFPLQDYERWLKFDFELIKRCDALLRIPGLSDGADREVSFAVDRGVPVFFDVETLLLWKKHIDNSQVQELAIDVQGLESSEV
jgi:hypothetical protein